MSKYFPKPKALGVNKKDELNLSNYVTESELKKATSVDSVDRSEFAEKVDLNNSKQKLIN